MPLILLLGAFVTGAQALSIAQDWWSEADENASITDIDKIDSGGSFLTWKRIIVLILVVVTFWKLLPIIKKKVFK